MVVSVFSVETQRKLGILVIDISGKSRIKHTGVKPSPNVCKQISAAFLFFEDKVDYTSDTGIRLPYRGLVGVFYSCYFRGKQQ